MSRIGYHTAASAIISMQTAMDVTANNIANINTNGFKASRPDFADLIYTHRVVDDDVQTGHGVKVDKTSLMYEQSSLRETGRMLDFAALDDGFFAVRTTSGDVEYTKCGSFNAAIGDGLLHDANGGVVLDFEGNAVEIPYVDDLIDYDSLKDLIGTYRFDNPYGLKQEGSNYYSATDSSGDAAADNTIKLKQGFIEASSTSLANEMSHVIEYQRAFQVNTNILRLNNELEDKINNLR